MPSNIFRGFLSGIFLRKKRGLPREVRAILAQGQTCQNPSQTRAVPAALSARFSTCRPMPFMSTVRRSARFRWRSTMRCRIFSTAVLKTSTAGALSLSKVALYRNKRRIDFYPPFLMVFYYILFFLLLFTFYVSPFTLFCSTWNTSRISGRIAPAVR